MRLADLPPDEPGDRLRGRGLFLRTGPFTIRLKSIIPDVIAGIGLLYADYQIAESEDFADFHVEAAPPSNLRRWFRPQVQFRFDGQAPFLPLPREHALPMLEWGLNWSISSYAHQYMIIHAAAIERGGRAAILPAPPGSGKSTLCAGLVHRGWRLLSDELCLVVPGDGKLVALARPINLKNQSIDVIGRFVSEAVFSRPAHDTAKGTVALLRAPGDSVARSAETAMPAWVILPKYVPGAPATLERRSKAETCIELGINAFNYSVHGAVGFDALGALIDRCDCYTFTYSSLDDAV
ncbi:MAG: HprK-related kinase A, partial [Proteobacteria bacterium]|nr:HprK-related kinase A [Pseudomonadota bacterium]